MRTFADDIEEAAGDEPIIGIIVASKRGWSYDPDPSPVQTWAEVRDSLDYEYDRGYGGLDCHQIYAWTASKVLVIQEYDGSSQVVARQHSGTPTRLL